MGYCKEEKKDELIRLITWMTEHPEMWRSVCTEKNMSAEECLEILEELEKQSFYMLIPVLIDNNIGNVEVDARMTRLFGKKLVESWSKMSMTDISTEFKDILRGA